jgi:diaminohydroxyphosphoribosylaminopyrimidine deaminase/5-amino-6-(5-phosphoribosylamino)uracil reductase
VIACSDASVFAAGEGAARLRAAGIAIKIGILEAEARILYSGYRPAAEI